MELTQKQRRRLDYASYVLRDLSLVYVETPKVACTSFKHSIAALSGIDFRSMQHTKMAAKTPALVIHDRQLFDVPTLSQLSAGELAAILNSSSYLRFCLVRDPFRRLASAWADRVLCRSISPKAPILRHLDFPRYRADWRYLHALFAEFVDHLYRVEFPKFTNHHWQLQHQLLLPGVLNYNLVIKLEDLSRDVTQLVRHIEAHGVAWPGLARLNDTPFHFGTSLYTPTVARKVIEMFEEDFDAYGYATTIDYASSASQSLPTFELVNAIQERNVRIFQHSLMLRGQL